VTLADPRVDLAATLRHLAWISRLEQRRVTGIEAAQCVEIPLLHPAVEI
jgi:hypothetical protein